MESAVGAVKNGFATSETMTVLIGQEGGIHILAQNDWPLERLAEERGARMAYRVSRNNGRVAVDGVEGATACHLEAQAMPERVKDILRDRPAYQLASTPRVLR